MNSLLSLLKRATSRARGLLHGQHVRPAQRAAAPASGMGDAQWLSGRFALGGLARTYRLYLPTPGRVAPQALPLMVMLHGCTQTAEDFAAGTGMNAAAERHGFAVLYPEQSPRANPQRCWNWYRPSQSGRGRGEAALLAQMAGHIAASHGLDAQRVFVAGLSAGGAMADALGEAYPDVFAGVAVHSGVAAGVATGLPAALAAMRKGPQQRGLLAPKRPRIVIHGARDTSVHPANAAAMAAPLGEPSHVSAQAGATRRCWAPSATAPRAEEWLVHALGHAWSGGSAAGSYTDPTAVSATDAIVAFFGLASTGNANSSQ